MRCRISGQKRVFWLEKYALYMDQLGIRIQGQLHIHELSL